MPKGIISSKNGDCPQRRNPKVDIALYVAWAIFAASLGYGLVAVFCVLKFRKKLSSPFAAPGVRGGVTLYKPLHGLDYGMKENLLSFCRQDYPDYQVVFGVCSADDPALSIVREVMAECPDVDTQLVINERSNANNPKVSNLINMDEVAKYEILVISDSDMRVGPDYLNRVVGEFSSDRTGLVTCLYKGTPAPGLASKLGAMFISQWFTPSALIAATFGDMKHCFGATMAIKRGTLKKIGGFEAIAGNLADDYTLGRLVREAGLDIRLANVVVENIIEETGLRSLILHELRWARTIRSVEPLGFLSTFLTDMIPLSLILTILSVIAGQDWVWIAAPLALAIIIRVALHISTKTSFISKHPVSFWVIPIRDLLSFFVRLLCYTGRTVNWRNSELSVGKGGKINNSRTGIKADTNDEKDTISEPSVLRRI